MVQIDTSLAGIKSQYRRDIFTRSPTHHVTRRCSLHPYHLAPPPPHRFSSNRGHNNNTSPSQNFHQNNTNPDGTRYPNNRDPQINVTFSPDTYTPHSNSSNHQQPRNPPGRGRNNGRHGRGHERSRNVTRDRGNSETRWTRDGQNMVEEPFTLENPAVTEDFTVPMIPDDDQPIVAVTTEE